MSNAKTGFILYFDSAPMLSELSPEQRGWLLTALFQYADRVWREPGTTQEEVLLFYPQLAPQTRTAFGFLASSIARDTQRWLRQREARSQRRQQQSAQPERWPGRGSPQAPAWTRQESPAELEQYRQDTARLRRALEESRREDGEGNPG